MEALSKLFRKRRKEKVATIDELLDYERSKKRKRLKELGEVFKEVSIQTKDFASHMNGASGK